MIKKRQDLNIDISFRKKYEFNTTREYQYGAFYEHYII